MMAKDGYQQNNISMEFDMQWKKCIREMGLPQHVMGMGIREHHERGWLYHVYCQHWFLFSTSHGTVYRLRPEQNGCQFAEVIFKHIFLTVKFVIFIQILLKFVAKGPIDNKSSLVQVMI